MRCVNRQAVVQLDFHLSSAAHKALHKRLRTGESLARTARKYPDSEALVDVAQNQRWTYAELDAEVDVVARGLMATGIGKGDRVGIWSPNCSQWTITQYAAARIGAILVNINRAYQTHELAYVVNRSGTRPPKSRRNQQHCKRRRHITAKRHRAFVCVVDQLPRLELSGAARA
jgi:acyl-CoA synthetase (AMP-forming)/AMP-acid ligase II